MQSYLAYKDGQLCFDGYPLIEVAKEFSTPCYVYSKTALLAGYEAFVPPPNVPFDWKICYAVKANYNVSLLKLLVERGANFDIVSGGELYAVLAAGGVGERVIFSGVNKSPKEITEALDAGVASIHIESMAELALVNEIAGDKGVIAPISFRVNPDVNAQSHPYITTGLKENKFGIPSEYVMKAYQEAMQCPHVHVHGIACHIGSQLTTLSPFLEALDKVLEWVDQLKKALGLSLTQIDLGGGLGIAYQDEQPPTPQAYWEAIIPKLSCYPGITVLMEPGRALIGPAGVLLTQVNFLKETPHKHFAMVDAGMNDFLRPALYGGVHRITPLREHSTAPKKLYDVVGPVCESADFMGKSRELALEKNDYLAIEDVGAYGFVMSSNYNARPRAAEVLILHGRVKVIREAEGCFLQCKSEVVEQVISHLRDTGC